MKERKKESEKTQSKDIFENNIKVKNIGKKS